MAYVSDNLMKNENLVYQAKIHWFIFLPGLILFFISLTFLGGDPNPAAPFVGSFIFLFAIVSLIKAAIIKFSTELAVTSKRVIAKTGLIRRSTTELNHSKVESFNVDQSLFGRIFGFGTVVINGTGGGKTPIPGIDDPLAFRKNAMRAIDASQSP